MLPLRVLSSEAMAAASPITRGARFIAFGRWEWDTRRNTFSLRLNKPDELEMLPGTWTPPEHALLRLAEESVEQGARKVDDAEDSDDAPEDKIAAEDEEDETDPSLAAIHVGRRVPVYRKLGEFRAKRLREIMHAVLSRI